MPSSLRVPEPVAADISCPKCAAINADDRKHYIWRVSDERGLHHECDVCAHSWVETSVKRLCQFCWSTLRNRACVNPKCKWGNGVG